ncbi:hypothetical protein D9613_010296 [Agrocybe pediades]|uniref:Uncharacterized protein n=1 Tax=Agrocybe pediades TaxID=84607 RepID=A0A8H4QFW9_9AGAR|nr:hypothetical protein D9613_010296 [Agrocybe pediades]
MPPTYLTLYLNCEHRSDAFNFPILPQSQSVHQSHRARAHRCRRGWPAPAHPDVYNLEDKRIDKVASVAQYVLKPNDSSVNASPNKFDALLTDGTLLADLDSVQVATGYRPFPNFVHVFEHSDNANGNRKTLVPLVTEDTIPNRIPSLHRLVMYAHNPSLAFIGATLAYTPFMIADIASTWLALAWLGEATYPETVRGRLRFEEERLATIQKRREATSCPSSLMVYNILGQDEQEYAASLRRDIVAARPDLDKCLPIWNDERTAIREVMYKTKYEALRYTRELALRHSDM